MVCARDRINQLKVEGARAPFPKPMFLKKATETTSSSRLRSLAVGLAVAASILWCGPTVHAQTLQLRYTFEDSGTTAASDPGGALNVPLTLLNFSGAATDLHGPANSGIQNRGHSLDLSAAVNAAGPQINGPIAQALGSPALGTLGVVSNFTAAIWLRQDSVITNTGNRAGRVFLMGTNGVVDQTSATTNDITLFFQTTNAIYGKINNSTFAAPLYFNPLPTNVWLFVAMVYDGTNASLYYGTEASPAKLISIRSIGAQTVDFGSGGGSGSLMLGNRSSDRTRAFDGWIDEFRFYTGSADATFIESLRQASTPVVISALYPDGMSLMQGTNVLSFTASSANGISAGNIKVAVNGTDVSSSLVIGGTSTSRSVSYTGLPVNPTLVDNASLNAVQLNIQVTDDGGIVTSNVVTYDSFSPSNFTWENEDYDFADDVLSGPAGLFIDNPRYAFETASDTYWQRQGMPPVDYSDGAAAPQNDVYRGPFDLAATEFSFSTGANGGPSVGELMRQKVLDALALNSAIRDVDVGNFDSGNWVNYTRTFPAGAFNVYARAAFGAGNVGGSALAEVTSGQGTPSQTTNGLGTFTIPNTGGWQSYQWVPLRDSNGNLVRVSLGGVKTLRLTAGGNGGGNNNFMMLTPANTNLPAISGVYPNGTNMFQPAANFSFTASTPDGTAINANSISVALTIRTILGTTTTNIASTNGLVVTGPSNNRNVSLPLTTNATYTAVVSVRDASGNPASTSVTFDTYAPQFVWEAEDYNYGSGQFINNPATAGYLGLAGTAEVDYHDNVTVSQNGTPAYRTADPVGLEVNGDAPKRVQFLGSGFSDYDVGWYDNGNWNNYTRAFPAGQYNVYLRAANGSTGNGGLALAKVTAGETTSIQTTTNLGSFTVPATGGWQAYTWVPLRDTSGNLVKFIGGGTQTLRATSSGGVNANFFALFPANTNVPAINSIYPSGTTMFQPTNRLSFMVVSAAGVNTNNIKVNLNGVQVTGLVFTGSPTSWNVSYTGLQLNTNHTATITAMDVNGNSATTTVNFDTFSASLFSWEAEDYDYSGGQYFDNPQVDAYAGLGATADVDYHDSNTGGTLLYRTSGTATEVTADSARAKFSSGSDYNIGFFGQNEWGNYTRQYPAGTYNVWGRFAAGGGETTAMLSKVTAGLGTTTQTTNFLGTFSIGNSGWGSYTWVPLRDDQGNMVKVALDGSATTLKLARGATGPDANVNFLMLAPAPAAASVTLSASLVGANIHLTFPTASGASYQVQYKLNLSDPTWTPLGSAVSGDGTTKSVDDPASGLRRFYQLLVQ